MSIEVATPEAGRHVMVDLETLGTEPFTPILSIGACRFNMESEMLPFADPENDLFYQAVTLESCLEAGLRPSASTVLWWMQQGKDAQQVFSDPNAVALPQALDAFTDWLDSRPDEMWGNSARFDFGLLSSAYRACGKVVPWDFRRERCYHTMKALPTAGAVRIEREGVHHNALDDAVSQARHLRRIMLHLEKKTPEMAYTIYDREQIVREAFDAAKRYATLDEACPYPFASPAAAEFRAAFSAAQAGIEAQRLAQM